MPTPREQLERVARDTPDVFQDVVERYRRLSGGEKDRIAALCPADRTYIFRIMRRDSASVEVAEANLRAARGIDRV